MKKLYTSFYVSTITDILLPNKGFNNIEVPKGSSFIELIESLSVGSYNLFREKERIGRLILGSGEIGNLIGEFRNCQGAICYLYGDLEKEPKIKDNRINYFTNFKKVLLANEADTKYEGLATTVLREGEINFTYRDPESILKQTFFIEFKTHPNLDKLNSEDWDEVGYQKLSHKSEPRIELGLDKTRFWNDTFGLLIPASLFSSSTVQELLKQLDICEERRLIIRNNVIFLQSEADYTLRDVMNYIDSLK